VALPSGGLMVNSSQGGGSKDTWVLSDGAPASAHSRGAGPDPAVNARSGARRLGHPDAGPALAADVADQEQQQQQSRVRVAAC
jgi:hypothetical protein